MSLSSNDKPYENNYYSTTNVSDCTVDSLSALQVLVQCASWNSKKKNLTHKQHKHSTRNSKRINDVKTMTIYVWAQIRKKIPNAHSNAHFPTHLCISRHSFWSGCLFIAILLAALLCDYCVLVHFSSSMLYITSLVLSVWIWFSLTVVRVLLHYHEFAYQFVLFRSCVARYNRTLTQFLV